VDGDVQQDPDADPPPDGDVPADPDVPGEEITPVVCDGNCHYVREGAGGSGDGSDWTNAWTGLPADLQRGHVYFVAAGSYPGYDFDDAESGEEWIVVRRATSGDHGTDTGWEGAFGEGVAQFDGTLTFSTSFIEVDGAAGGGPGGWETGFGFKIMITTEGTKNVRVGDGVGHVTLAHIDMENTGLSTNDDNADIVYAPSGNHHLTISRCFLHDVCRTHLLTRGGSNILIEYSKIARNGGEGDDIHREALSDTGSDRIVIRWSIFEDITNTGILVALSSGCTDPSTGGDDEDDWEIYGNVFWRKDWGSIGAGAIQVINCERAHRWKVYNNTFVGLHSLQAGVRLENASTDNEAYNNLWYGNLANAVVVTGGFVSDYNWFGENMNFDDPSLPSMIPEDEPNIQLGTGNPLIDWENGDFGLAAATDAGFSLPAPYNVDMFGNVRGADGVWDRGAIELP